MLSNKVLQLQKKYIILKFNVTFDLNYLKIFQF